MVTTLVGSLIILVAFFIGVAIFLHFVPLGLWISAMAAGSSVGIFTLIGMRLRRVPPGQIVMPLIKANKEFELVVIPGAGHTMGEAYGDHKRFDFFVKNLLNVTPPAWEELEKR